MQLPSVSPHRPGILVPARIDPSGLSGPTRHQAEGRAWQRVARGLYLPASVRVGTAQRIANAAATLPSSGGVTGWAALHWYGATWFDGVTPDGKHPLLVDLATGPRDIRCQPDTLVSAEHFGPHDILEHDGLRLTTPQRSVLFAMRHAPSLVEATVVLDMACAANVVSIREAIDYAALLGTWTGIPQARAAISMADEDSWSPMETRLRLIWTEQALRSRPECNLAIFDLTGRHLGTADLCDPAAGVVGEYDGGLHLDAARRHRDIGREARFRAHGLEYFTVVGADMRSPRAIARRIDAAYERAGWVPGDRRRWSIQPPPDWHAPRGVEQRRAELARRRRRSA